MVVIDEYGFLVVNGTRYIVQGSPLDINGPPTLQHFSGIPIISTWFPLVLFFCFIIGTPLILWLHQSWRIKNVQ